MADSRPQFGFAGFSDPRFWQALQQALPLLEMLVEMAHAYSPGNSNAENPLPCTTCPKTGQCSTPYDRLEALLPGKYAGSAIINNTAGDLINDTSDFGATNPHENEKNPDKPDRSFLRAIDIVRSDEIFGLYKNCSFIFTLREWRVITLKVQQGKTYRTIGEELGIAPSTASDTFQRARKKMERFYRKKGA